jgi:hypothetical protein
MLTKKDILKLYSEGLEIKFRRKKHPQGLKGDYDPSSCQINIYAGAVSSEYERDLTLLHELIHARDDRHGKKRHTRPVLDSSIEKEALQTYEKKPHILSLIKELYKI